MSTATIVTLPQMVDLALNSPEVGIVNFTVLHSLLHVIVKQLDLVDTNVEFRGSDSDRLQSYIANAKPGPLLTLTEYIVGEDGTEKKDDKKRLKKGIHGIVEKGKSDEEQREKDVGHTDSQNKVIVVESSKDIAGGPTVVVTKHHFDKLEADVRILGKKVKDLAELPANSALIEVLRGESYDKTPVLDMFQILNLSKRLDAAEVGMQKLASLMEDLAKREPLMSSEEADLFNEKTQELKRSLEGSIPEPALSQAAISHRLEMLEKAVFDGNFTQKRGSEQKQKTGSLAEAASLNEKSGSADKRESTGSADPGKKSISSEKSSPSEQFSPKEKDSPTDRDRPVDKSRSGSQDVPMQGDFDDLKETLKLLVEDVDEIKKMLGGETNAENLPPEVRLNQLDVKYADCQEQLTSLDHMFCRQIEILQKRITDLEKDVGEMVEKVTLGMATAETSQPDGQTVGELYNKLLQLQEEMAVVAENAQKLLDDREEKQHTLDIMIEQIELLKTVKADREDLEDALADKADACLVNRKVSVEQFDATCGDMTRAIEDSLAKLAQQEELWAHALEDIQKEIGAKLDKEELTPLREYINKKLKNLHDKFKSLAALKREAEAAGTKSRYLRNVNCISCDKDVIMRKQIDATQYPKAYALPPTRSMAPYLTYELDQLRKQQKHVPPKKDLISFENALRGAKTPRGTDHLCNRYCGGSHTVTTPQQRVTRLGHFLEQWGPEIGLAQDTMIRGCDGHMYRGRDDKTSFPAPTTEISITHEETTITYKTGTPTQTAPITKGASATSASGLLKGEGEPSVPRKKSSVKAHAQVVDPEQPPTSGATAPNEEEPPPLKRKSKSFEAKGRSPSIKSNSKSPRKRSKGSSGKLDSSTELKAEPVPEEKIPEEPIPDEEANEYEA